MLENSVTIVGQAVSIVLGIFSTYIIFNFMTNFERNIHYKKYVYVISYVLFTSAIFISNIFIGGIVNLIINILLTVLVGHFLFNNKRIYFFYYTMYIVMIFLIQTIVALLFEFTFFALNIKFYSIEIYINTISLITQFVSLGVSRLLIIYFNNKNIKRFNIVQYLNFLILPLFSIFYIVSLLLYVQMYMTIGDIALLIINVILIIILNIFITNIFESISKNNELKNQLNLYRQQSEMEYRYYENLNNKYNNSRKLIHDMKNHMQTIENLYKEKEVDKAKAYTKDMYLMLDKLYHKRYIDNKVLNIILNDKTLKAEEFNIDFTCNVGQVNMNFIKDIDLTTIFSNILDNSIEAVKDLDINRNINLKIDRFNEFIIINLSNYTSNEPIVVNGRFKSTKNEHSGFGLENVKIAVEKYEGSIRINYEKNIFKVNIIIPINI